MSESFDPYRVWLAIPPESRPPTHYELLGISPKETENAVINAAVQRQSAYVRNFQIGKHAADANRILNEIAAAKVCLLDPVKRAKYDAELKAKNSPISSATLAPVIDLDQLAASTTTMPRSPLAGGARGRPRRLVTSSRRRKPSALFWQIPVAVGATIVIAGLAFMILRPRNGEAVVESDTVHSNSDRATATTAAVDDESGPAGLINQAAPAIDLLKLIDVERDKIFGDWRMESGKLRVVPSEEVLAGRGDAPVIRLPYRPAGDYTLRITARRANFGGPGDYGGFVVPIVYARGSLNMYLSTGWKGSRIVELEPTGDKVDFLPSGKPMAITCAVYNDGFVVSNEAGTRIERRGIYGKATWSPSDVPRGWLFLRARGNYEFSELTVFPAALVKDPLNEKPAVIRADADRARSHAKDWTYGYGTFDPLTSRVTEFTQLPYFDGSMWRGSADWPDKHLGWVTLVAAGGHPDHRHAVIRRWIAPADGIIAIDGTLTHGFKGEESDGVRGRVVAGHSGVKGEWSVNAGAARTAVEPFSIKTGEAVDVVVDSLDTDASDGFDWPVRLELKSESGEIAGTWDSVADFAGPERAARAVSQFAEFQGHWHLRYPAPYEHMLAIDADGNVDFSGDPNISWRGLLRKDGDAVLLERDEEPLARLRIENAMLLAEKLRVIPDWRGDAGSGIGTRAEGTGARQDGRRPRTSQLRDGDDSWADFDLHGNAVVDGFARLTGTAISTKESYSGPLDISVVARADKNSIRLFAYGHAGLIFNWEVDPNQFVGWTPNGGFFKHAVSALKPNTWYRLRWKITEKLFQVFVDDQLIFEERGEYDLRASNPVFVQGGVLGSTTDVKSFTVTPLTEVDE